MSNDPDRPAFNQGPAAYKPLHGNPAYEKYRTELQGKRDLWGTADVHRNVVNHYQERLNEPNLTDQGKATLQARLGKAQARLGAAKDVAKRFGVDADAEFPRDEMMYRGTTE